ncbi:hypothetical protein MGALJ_01760 [Mycobacterium gallinarum]|uniref:Uncharacterized protein n=1 Tax=Mycobacterium gallinarum TaxID=39689 RepID=A0A9W4FCX7_9MYCO|nr:hypothetical protein MGALJ_01760 [Mycobacterium gallinarum]
MTRRTELPHHEGVKGRSQGRRDFPCDGNAAARQAEHNDTFASTVCAEHAGQHTTSFATIAKDASGFAIQNL